MPLSAPVLVETTDRAAALEAELRDFSYMVSHDLGASLRHVTQFSRLLTAELGDGMSSRQRAHVEYIQSAAARCQAMMDALLAFSQAQHTAMAPTRHDATQTMRLAMRQQSSLETSGAKVTLTPLGEVFADANIEVPALFIAGARDIVLQMIAPDALDIMRRRVPDLRGIELIEQAGHFVQMEQPAATNRALLGFLDSLRRER